jgi:nucleotide-binding universal stress UspA family protein
MLYAPAGEADALRQERDEWTGTRHSGKESEMKIMMYYDGTECTREALPVVMMRAKAFKAEVHVVSSLPSGRERDLDAIEKMNEDLGYIEGVFQRQQVPCETHLLITGHGAEDDIAAFARRHKVDEIIIGTEKRSFMERFLTGWMARRVIGNTQCPVLLA